MPLNAESRGRLIETSALFTLQQSQLKVRSDGFAELEIRVVAIPSSSEDLCAATVLFSLSTEIMGHTFYSQFYGRPDRAYLAILHQDRFAILDSKDRVLDGVQKAVETLTKRLVVQWVKDN